MILRTPRTVAAARAGFTLTEMLVVVAIIVVLAAIAVPTTMFLLGESREDIAHAHIKGTLIPACNIFKTRHPEERYPHTLEELITQDQETGRMPLLKPEALRDPWGQQYQYQLVESGEPKIWTISPNGGREISNYPSQ